jgi:transcription elongation factor SPT6
MDSVLTHTPANPEPDPETLAAEFMNSPENREFVDIGSVLKACRYVLAREIAYDPHVRTSLRSTFYDHVEVSTFPTTKGRKEIDRLHEYFVRKIIPPPIICSNPTQLFFFFFSLSGELTPSPSSTWLLANRM